MGSTGIGPIQGGSPRQVVLAARVQGAGSSSPSTIKGSQQISSVSRVSVGRYRVFLRESFPQCESISVLVQDTNYATTPTRKTAKVISHDIANGTAASRYIDVAVVESGFVVDELTNPLAAAAAGLKAATATVTSTVSLTAADLLTAGKDELAARPRNITFTTAGVTPANAPATATVTGTDVNGDAITETITLAQTATIAEGAKAFKTITAIDYPAGDGTAATVSIGYGNKFGLSRKARTRAGAVMRGTEISAGSVVTNGTLVVAATGLPNGTYTPNTAPDGANDYAIAYETDGESDLSSTEWLHITINDRNSSLGVS